MKKTRWIPFEDITERAGAAYERYNSSGVLFADVNCSGNLDLLIISLTDLNTLYLNDGNVDLFISQNSFGFPPLITRLSAERGLLLKGNGQTDLVVNQNDGKRNCSETGRKSRVSVSFWTYRSSTGRLSVHLSD